MNFIQHLTSHVYYMFLYLFDTNCLCSMCVIVHLLSGPYNINIHYTYTLLGHGFYCLCCTFALGRAPISQRGQKDQPKQRKREIILSFICPYCYHEQD